jgi:hypothetical protein
MSLVIISGALANKPFNGGNAWSRLSWALGFQKVGFEVCFVEQIHPDTCVDAAGRRSPFHSSVNLAYFQQTMSEFGFSTTSSLICGEGSEVHGLPLNRLTALAEKACLLFNLSGHLTLAAIKAKVACRLYYDDDPGYTQFWHSQGDPGTRLSDHEFYFTLGGNIGKPDCPIPSNGIHWHVTRPPVVMNCWQAVERPQLDRFTTIASWRGAYAPIKFNGSTYGVKAHEFRKVIALPQRSPCAFEIALQIHPGDSKDIEALRAHGWRLSDPFIASSSPGRFRQFVQSSGAEFSVAQGIYVETNSGWFSDRTVRYLASGRPALVQDTGFARHYPCGEGLIPFSNLDEAVDGAERIAGDYGRHCAAARRVAEAHFDSDKVIREIARTIGLSLP